MTFPSGATRAPGTTSPVPPPAHVAPAAPGTSYADLPEAPPAYHQQGASAPSGRRRHRTPLAWLPWALLGAIALLLLLSLLLGALADGSSSDSASGTGASTGTLTAQGADVLGDAGALRGHVGQPATGTGVLVQSVVSDEGFWVGSSGSDRVFVHLAKSSRQGQAESPFQVRAGQHVDLTGTVTRLGSSSVRDLGVEASEGAGQLTSAGAYVEATRVALSS